MDRITRKDLKTDKFAQEVTHTVEYVGEHRKQFERYGAVALVLVVAVAGFWMYRGRDKVKRQDELAVTMRVMEASVGQPSQNPLIPSFATQAEKDKAATKAFNDYISKYSGTDEAYIVKYYLAILNADAGKLPEAEKGLQEVASSATSAIASLAKFSLAQIYQAENKRADAEKLMRSLIDIRGFYFDLHLQPQYEQVNFDLYLGTRESASRIKELARETHRRCPQLGLFRLAKIPMVVTWYREGSSKSVAVDRFSIGTGGTPEDALLLAAKKAARQE